MGRKSKRPIVNSLERDCPECGVKIYYKNIYSTSNAAAENTLCKICWRRKMSQSPENREKHRIYGKEHAQEFLDVTQELSKSPETLAKLSASLKLYYQDADNRHSNSERLRLAHQNPDAIWNTEEYKLRREVFWKKGLQIAHSRRSPFSKGEKDLANRLNSIDNEFTLNSGHLMIGKYLPDIINISKKVIVEFYGDYYHCNPRDARYTPDFYNKCKKKTSQEVWDADSSRVKCLEDNGYKVFIVWESDFRYDPQKCVNLILSECNPLTTVI